MGKGTSKLYARRLRLTLGETEEKKKRRKHKIVIKKRSVKRKTRIPKRKTRRVICPFILFHMGI